MKFSIPPKAKEVHFKTLNKICLHTDLTQLKFNTDLN